MAVPIWKDYYFTINKTSAEFRLRLNDSSGAIIYTGKAFAKPNESSIKLKVNDICADYIAQSLPSFDVTFVPANYTRTFYVQYYNTSTEAWSNLGSVEFLWDWSYNYGYSMSRDGLSFPINPLVDRRQYLVKSLTSYSATKNITLRYLSGGSGSVSADVVHPDDFNTDKNTDYAPFEMSPSIATIVFMIDDYDDVKEIVADGMTYPVDNSGCHTHVLYYLNAYGGWDSLLLMGRVSQADSYERFMQSVDADNSNHRTADMRNYVNGVQKKFTLQTGWLTDLGASRMHHLLGSTMVYLHDLVEGYIYPANITNADCPYKTYGGEGNRLVNYTIEATLSRNMHRL